MRHLGNFTVAGQGAISFTASACGPFQIVLCEDEEKRSLEVILEIDDEKTSFSIRDSESSSLLAVTNDVSAVLENKSPCRYWLSLDGKNRLLRFGKGEMLPQLCFLEAYLPCSQRLSGILLSGSPEPDPERLVLLKTPITIALPNRIIPPEHMTLNDIALGRAGAIAALPREALGLYWSISGPEIRLNDYDFPNFAEAISRSIVTPGSWCHETLKKKAKIFGGSDHNQSYLRVTMGENQGSSPGSPYVLEIWPAGHYSPIHNHGNAWSIVKVVHGDIAIEHYAELDPKKVQPFNRSYFQEGDITFVSPELYQIHRVVNESDVFAATVHGFCYSESDVRHYEYFDYIGSDDRIHQFEPNSDCELIEFKRIMRWEAQNEAGRARSL